MKSRPNKNKNNNTNVRYSYEYFHLVVSFRGIILILSYFILLISSINSLVFCFCVYFSE